MMNPLLKEERNKNLIMIVDDISQNLQVLGSILYDNDYDVAMADNGLDAINIIEDINPDLILLDIMMPEMDGYETCRKIKENPNIKDIPIIFLTARNDEESIVKGFKTGAVDFICKPFNASELIERVKNHVELKTSREKIISYSKNLEKLIEEKNEFLGIAAHDMKNPISNILCSTNLMLSTLEEMNHKDNKEFKELINYMNLIKDTSNYMYRTINELLNVETLESGSLKLNISQSIIGNIIRSAISHNQLSANAKNLTFHVSQLCNICADIDEDRFWEILDNLISNSIKYSPKNKNIYISVYKVLNTEENINSKYSMILSIRDEGPGLTDDDKKHVFGKFQRLSAIPTAGENSSGLGLSIVKKLTELQGGTAFVESNYGNGANFMVKFCISDSQAEYYPFVETLVFETFSDKIKALTDNKNILSMESLLNDFKNKKINNELIDILENKYIIIWDKISKSHIVNEIHKFATEIRELGKQCDCDILLEFGNELINNTLAFDIEKISIIMNYFPEIINKLKVIE